MNFHFEQAQIEQILNILALRPYNEVFQIINNIQQQAAQQMREASAPRTSELPLQAVN